MENSTNNKETIAIILAMVIPGSGHIYLGKEHLFYGVKTSILFVIISFIFFNIARPFLFGVFYLINEGLGEIIVPSVIFLPIFIIWYKQLFNIIKITKQIDLKLSTMLK